MLKWFESLAKLLKCTPEALTVEVLDDYLKVSASEREQRLSLVDCPERAIGRKLADIGGLQRLREMNKTPYDCSEVALHFVRNNHLNFVSQNTCTSRMPIEPFPSLFRFSFQHHCLSLPKRRDHTSTCAEPPKNLCM